MFNRHGGGWTVKSSAIGGTTACEWAARKGSLSLEAATLFPPNGPDFVWYTLGGNDIASSAYQNCLLKAKTEEEIQKCNTEEVEIISNCTNGLLDDFFSKFPKSKVMQCFYDFLAKKE